jgi:hypothetical protein
VSARNRLGGDDGPVGIARGAFGQKLITFRLVAVFDELASQFLNSYLELFPFRHGGGRRQCRVDSHRRRLLIYVWKKMQ